MKLRCTENIVQWRLGLKSYLCAYQLECWGEFRIRSLEGLGYPSASPIARAIEDRARVKCYTSKVPIGVETRALDEYLLVERALNHLGEKYRIVAFAEHVAPVSVVGRSMAKRAQSIGISISVYRRRLELIHQEIIRIFDERNT